MAILLSMLLGFLPMFFFAWIVYWLDRYEKEPKRLLGGVFFWGAIVASCGAFLVNTTLGIGIFLVTNSEEATQLATGSLIAPVVEEVLKGFAVLMVYLIFRQEFDSILDGIVYAAIAALGFAASENTYYIYNYGYLQSGMDGIWGMAFIRIIMVGWQHPFYTAFTGIGLAISRTSRDCLTKGLAPILGLTLGVLAHAAHNTISDLLSGGEGLILGTLFDWLGWFFMLLFIGWVIKREQHWLELYLREEVDLGTITANQYKNACSAWRQSLARINALYSGNYRNTWNFYQTCAELIHKKHQLEKLGDENGNAVIIKKLRDNLALLSGQITS